VAQTKAKTLTAFEKGLLLQLINAMEMSEWSEGDYCLTQRQFNALQNAKRKLSDDKHD